MYISMTQNELFLYTEFMRKVDAEYLKDNRVSASSTQPTLYNRLQLAIHCLLGHMYNSKQVELLENYIYGGGEDYTFGEMYEHLIDLSDETDTN